MPRAEKYPVGPTCILQFQRQQIGPETDPWKPQVLTLGSLNLVKWNSHFYFSVFKELYLKVSFERSNLEIDGRVLGPIWD